MGEPHEPDSGAIDGELLSVKPRPDALERKRMLARVTAGLTESAEAPVKIDRYVVVDKLGSGGMGVVYSAYDPKLDRKVAIKLVHARDRDTSGHAALLEEARSLARLTHPNVVAVHEVGELPAQGGPASEAELFIVMELVEGGSLSEWREAASRSEEELLEVFVQAARGLGAAHDQNLVHRDFKPSNVLVGEDGRVRVVDFGLAVDRTAPVSDRAGTPAYMAPEQHEFGELDARSDQYAFCVALYEALTGSRPFQDETIRGLLEAKQAGPPPEGLSKLRGRVAGVLRRGLSPDPGLRFPTMEALAEALVPRPASSRGAFVGAGILLAGAVALVVSVVSGPAEDPCGAAGQRVREVWDEEMAEDVEKAFASTKLSFHAQAAEGVLARIEDYAAQWADQSRQACEAGVVRKEHSEAFHDQQVGCLAGRLDELDALVGVLRDADDEIVRHAQRATDALGSLDACRDDEYLRRRVEPPRSQDAAEMAAVRAELLRAAALRRAGKPDASKERLVSVASRVDAIDYAPLRAQAALGRGLTEDQLGLHEDAERSLREAWQTALAAHDDDQAVVAATQLVSTVGWGRAETAQGLVWAENARALMDRAGIEGEPRARLLHAEGGVLRLAGRFDEALSKHEAALSLSQSIDDQEGLFTANLRNGIATVLVELGRFKEAMAQFEHALDIRTRLLADAHPSVATVLDNMGVATFERGDVESAVTYYERALAIREDAFGPDHREVGASLNNLGDAYRALGRYEDARARHERAHRIFVETLGPDHPNVAVAVANIGNVLWYEDRLDEALQHYRKALGIFERAFGPDHTNVATMLDNVARVLTKQERLDEALDQRNRALEILEPTFGSDHPQTIRVRSALGELLLRMDRPKAAEAELEAALAASERSEVEPLRKAELRFALARAAARNGDRARARSLAARAREIYEAHPDPAHDNVGALQAWVAEAKIGPL